jgi:hypothetical protein
MAKMKKFMMDDGRFGSALRNCCDGELNYVSIVESDILHKKVFNKNLHHRSTTTSLSYQENDISDI